MSPTTHRGHTQGWRLDSPLSFYGSIFFTLGFAIFYESLSKLRRTVLYPAPWRTGRPTLWRLSMASLFSLQLTCGYLLMLIAMTYQVRDPRPTPSCSRQGRRPSDPTTAAAVPAAPSPS